jgi:hypothetical protein
VGNANQSGLARSITALSKAGPDCPTTAVGVELMALVAADSATPGWQDEVGIGGRWVVVVGLDQPATAPFPGCWTDQPEDNQTVACFRPIDYISLRNFFVTRPWLYYPAMRTRKKSTAIQASPMSP